MYGLARWVRIAGDAWTGENVEIAPDAQLIGPIYLGNEVLKIKGGAVVHGPTFIRDYTIVDNRAQVDRSLVWRNCYIGEGAELRGTIVCRAIHHESQERALRGQRHWRWLRHRPGRGHP